jgi:hypothetical protein
LFASKIAVTCAFNIDTDEERERERVREDLGRLITAL